MFHPGVHVSIGSCDPGFELPRDIDRIVPAGSCEYHKILIVQFEYPLRQCADMQLTGATYRAPAPATQLPRPDHPGPLCNCPPPRRLLLTTRSHWITVTFPSDLDQLYLPKHSLRSSLPPRLGLLTDLRILNLASNRLSGSIPLSCSELICLEMLDLSRNWLSGELPSYLTRLVIRSNCPPSPPQLGGSLPNHQARFTIAHTKVPKAEIGEAGPQSIHGYRPERLERVVPALRAGAPVVRREHIGSYRGQGAF